MTKYQVGDEVLLRNGETVRVIGVRQMQGSEPEFVTNDDPYFWRPERLGDIPSSFDVIMRNTPPKRTKADRVLLELAAIGEEYSMSFGTIAAQTGLTRFEVAAACRYLASEGWAKFTAGLMNYEECQVAGAGYAVTAEGLARAKEWL